MDFNIELAQGLLDSPEQFPVDLLQAWVWLGYSTKQKALNTLESYFEEGVDYIFITSEFNNQDKNNQQVKKAPSGRSSHLYFLTTNCLKEFGMIARTPQGKLIRGYFLECEQIAKRAISQPKAPSTEVPLVMPTQQEIAYMKSREWEKLEMAGIRVEPEEIKRRSGYRRAIDIARSFSEKASQNALPPDEKK